MITTLEPTWREWVLTNLRRKCTPESIVAAMVEKDFDPVFANAVVAVLAAELQPDTSSPVQGATAPSVVQAAPATRPTVPGGEPDEDAAQHGRLPVCKAFRTSDRAVEVLARVAKPEILLFANVLSHAECEELIRRSSPKLDRSTTVDPATGEAKVIERRTSAGTYFALNSDEFIAAIDRRVSELLHWPVNQSEGLQILRYDVGGEYRPHFDYFPPNDPGSRHHMTHGGQRIGTLIMYLNDVEDGGETIFPEIGLTVTPRRGQGVYFGYFNARGEVDPLTLHGGAPVRAGEKWIATKWLRQFDRT